MWQIIQNKEHGYDFMSKDILRCVKKCQILYQFQNWQVELVKKLQWREAEWFEHEVRSQVKNDITILTSSNLPGMAETERRKNNAK